MQYSNTLGNNNKKTSSTQKTKDSKTKLSIIKDTFNK